MRYGTASYVADQLIFLGEAARDASPELTRMALDPRETFHLQAALAVYVMDWNPGVLFQCMSNDLARPGKFEWDAIELYWFRSECVISDFLLPHAETMLTNPTTPKTELQSVLAYLDSLVTTNPARMKLLRYVMHHNADSKLRENAREILQNARDLGSEPFANPLVRLEPCL